MNEKTIYTIACSHLDTVWLWDFETTLKEYIPATLRDNFRLFEKYPAYRFGWEGSYRYELAKEYYPEEYEKLREYVREGKWYPTGSAFENGDVNIPSPEALIRNILFGSRFFKEEFGTDSNEIFLPDCFGFGYALPSIMRHCSLKGFSTQKLSWGSAYGAPFDIGRWFGVDGSWVYGNCNPGNYSCTPLCIRNEKFLKEKLAKNSASYSLCKTVRFYGTGDRGGAPAESALKMLSNEIAKNPQENIKVKSVNDNELFEIFDSQLTAGQKAALPTWDNELVMTNHGVGSYTSRSAGKRFNKQCEIYADMAERACVAAEINGVYSYPHKVLTDAWKRFIAHQFHDDITGTSFQKCYKRSWNDYILSQKQFTQELGGAVTSLSSLLDTSSVKGTAVSVFNSLQYSRSECVRVNLPVPKGKEYVRVYDGKKEIPSGITAVNNGIATVIFCADIDGFELKAFDVRFSDKPSKISSALYVDGLTFGNSFVEVRLDDCGNIVSVFNKEIGRELLSGKSGYAVFDYMGSKSWPAWELTYKELSRSPKYFSVESEIELLLNSPACVAFKISGKIKNSVYTQLISLGCNDRTVRVYNDVNWLDTKSLLKMVFPTASGNPSAAYDLGLGAIRRKNSTEKLYEVPAQLWADVTAEDSSFGVSVFSDSRAGWDKPNDNELRLTAVHTPYYSYRQECSQHLMDLGINRFSYGIFGHGGAVGSDTQREALCFATPLVCAVSKTKHDGKECIKLASVSDSSVIVRAIKKSEDGKYFVVRFNEGEGKAKKNISFTFGNGIRNACEADGCENIISKAKVKSGTLTFDISAYGIKTFLLEVVESKSLSVNKYTDLKLPFNTRVICTRGVSAPRAIPAEMMPEKISTGGFEYNLTGNAVTCLGQKITVPASTKSVRLLVNSKQKDVFADFISDGKKVSIKIPSAYEAVGAWDLFGLKETGYIKKDKVAYVFTHTRENGRDNFGDHMYLFEVEIPCTKELVLPINSDICIYSGAAVFGESDFSFASELVDKLEKRAFNYNFSREDLARMEAKFSPDSLLMKNFKVEFFGICGKFQLADFTSQAKRRFFEGKHHSK